VKLGVKHFASVKGKSLEFVPHLFTDYCCLLAMVLLTSSSRPGYQIYVMKAKACRLLNTSETV